MSYCGRKWTVVRLAVRSVGRRSRRATLTSHEQHQQRTLARSAGLAAAPAARARGKRTSAAEAHVRCAVDASMWGGGGILQSV